MKRFTLLLLTLILTFVNLPETTFAKTNDEAYIDEDMAKTLSIMFISTNFNTFSEWNTNTRISEVISLYDNKDEINAYCIKLETDGKQTGYITISTNLHETLIQEYSDQAIPVFEKAKTFTEYSISKSQSSKIYYYGPLQYGDSKQNIGSEVMTCSMPEYNHYNENLTLVSSLKGISKDISLLSNSSSSYITSPYTYLQELRPGEGFQLDDSKYMLGIDGYEIAGHNACSVYGVAVILTYHLKGTDGIGVEARAEKCKELAVKYGYATTDNYYISVGSLKGFANKCLEYYNSTLKADSDLFYPWNSAKSEISNNRPVLINISSAPGSGYADHTVVAYGWSIYKNSASDEYRFYKVRDGYSKNEIRYVDVERLSIYYITKIN